MPPKSRPEPLTAEPTAPGAAPPVDNSTATPQPGQQPPPLVATAPVVPAATPTTLVDEVTNPAGPPEGVEQPSAAPEAHGDPTGPSDAVQPTQADLGSTTVTTEDEPPTPLATPGAPGDYVLTSDPVVTLEAYLGRHYPADRLDGEHPATTAVRLLTRLGAAGTQGARCQAPYCNLPAGHQNEHGWVHVEPGTARG